MFLLATLGAFAGLITTLSGFGGGVFLVTCLALLWDPLTALTISSLALLLGNAQRLYLFRASFDWHLSLPVISGCIPGALAGALIATALPAWFLHIAIVVATLGSLVRFLIKRNAALPHWVLAPGSAVVAFLSATTGGGGFLMGPMLLGAGISGSRYIATASSAGAAIHLFRITGYSTNGLIDFSMLTSAVILAGSIMLGNLLGRDIRHRIGEGRMRWIEYAAPALCAALAIAGL